MEPDVLCMAKAITGGYGGLGAVITTSKIANAINENFGLYSTYGWHPRAVAAALANLRYLTATGINFSSTPPNSASTSSPGCLR